MVPRLMLATAVCRSLAFATKRQIRFPSRNGSRQTDQIWMPIKALSVPSASPLEYATRIRVLQKIAPAIYAYHFKRTRTFLPPIGSTAMSKTVPNAINTNCYHCGVCDTIKTSIPCMRASLHFQAHPGAPVSVRHPSSQCFANS